MSLEVERFNSVGVLNPSQDPQSWTIETFFMSFGGVNVMSEMRLSSRLWMTGKAKEEC